MKKKVIGVLGGIGAVASANFYQELIKVTQEKYNAKYDDDYPQVIINSLSFSGFDNQGKGDEVNIKAQLVDGLNQLYKAGADFGVIACNTVHQYLDFLTKNTKLEILSIVDATIEEIIKANHSCVGILSSSETKDVGLYSKAINNIGLNFKLTTNKEQKILDKIIANVMSGNVLYKDKKNLSLMIDKMSKAGVDGVILGCTELPLAFCPSLLKKEIIVYNTNRILAQAAIFKSLGF